jgi:hypothetical protein
MPTKRIVAFVIAILIMLISFLTAFMFTACESAIEELNQANTDEISGGGALVLSLGIVTYTLVGGITLIATIVFSAVSLILALSNTKPSRCEVKLVRVTSWVIFGINCATVLYVIIMPLFV